MKIGIRKPSIGKRIAARTSVKRAVRNSLGLKAPRGYGWLTNPRKAAYNRVYNRTTKGCLPFLVSVFVLFGIVAFAQPASALMVMRTNNVYIPSILIMPTPTFTPSPPPTPTVRPNPTATTVAPGACNCTGLDLDCSDFGTHNAAQACYSYCVTKGYGDVFDLDGDGDGQVCESLP
jgi:hypothetical protein